MINLNRLHLDKNNDKFGKVSCELKCVHQSSHIIPVVGLCAVPGVGYSPLPYEEHPILGRSQTDSTCGGVVVQNDVEYL